MNEDEFKISTPFFSLGIKKADNETKIKEGETIIGRSWSWRKMGYVRKSFRVVNGVTVVQVLD